MIKYLTRCSNCKSQHLIMIITYKGRTRTEWHARTGIILNGYNVNLMSLLAYEIGHSAYSFLMLCENTILRSTHTTQTLHF